MPRPFVAALLIAAASPAAAATPPANLVDAIRSGDVAAVERRLQAEPALLGARTDAGATPLIIAALSRDDKGFVRPENNPVFRAIAARMRAPGFLEACLLGDMNAVEAGLARDPAAARSGLASGWTALHFAAFAGKLDVMRRLIAAGASVDQPAPRSFGATPVTAALLAERVDAAELLFRHGASPFGKTEGGNTYVHEAATSGSAALIELLARHGVPLDARREDGLTPIEVAQLRDNREAAAAIERLVKTQR